MRNLDKKFHKALKFFDKNTKAKLDRLKREELQTYRKYVVEDIERDLVELGYIDMAPENVSTYGLTPKGQEELRILDKIIYDIRVLIISLIALFFSLLSISIEIYRIIYGGG